MNETEIMWRNTIRQNDLAQRIAQARGRRIVLMKLTYGMVLNLDG